MNKLLLIGACGLVLGVAGCGSDDESDTSGDTGAATGATAEKTVTAGGGTNREVVMKDTQFNPGETTVKKGTTITWPNEDSFDHDVTKKSGPGAGFESGTVAGGDSYKHKFTTAGKVDYVCTIHPGMDGSVTVK